MNEAKKISLFQATLFEQCRDTFSVSDTKSSVLFAHSLLSFHNSSYLLYNCPKWLDIKTNINKIASKSSYVQCALFALKKHRVKIWFALKSCSQFSLCPQFVLNDLILWDFEDIGAYNNILFC